LQTKSPNVEGYMQELPSAPKVPLEQLRLLCLEILGGYQECMEYGMPAYRRDGNVEVAFASQKQYISLYILKRDVVDRHRSLLGGTSIGKGCIRFVKPERIDFEAVRRMLQGVASSKSEPC